MTGVEAELADRLRAIGADASPWSNGPGDRYGSHRHPYDKILVVAHGSIVFGLTERGTSVALSVGDRLDLPAGTEHDAIVGPDGVTCLEAHLPSGSVGSRPARKAAGGW